MTSISELIEYELGEEGYSFAEVEAVPELDRDNKEVKVVFYIQPKDRVTQRFILQKHYGLILKSKSFLKLFRIILNQIDGLVMWMKTSI